MSKKKVKQRKVTAQQKQKLKAKTKQEDPEALQSESEEEETTTETQNNEVDQEQQSSEEPDGETPSTNESSQADSATPTTGPKVVVKCKHLKQANPPQIKKTIEKGKAFECVDCVIANLHGNKKKQQNKKKASSSSLKQNALWMCLSCGTVGCGRDVNQHAKTHAAFKHHSLVVNLDTLEAFCYDCDEFIEPVDKVPEYEKLNSCIEELQFSSPTKEEPKEFTTVEKPSKKESKQPNHNKEPQITGYNGIRGLNNLGNTCFFNAVMQNLTHTPILRDYLLAPVPVMEGPLTTVLRDFMFSMWKQTGSSHNPKQLLTEICKKAKRFSGGRQQDSQELLRYLLDGLDIEEKKRVKMSHGKETELKESADTPSNLNLKNVSYTQQKGFVEEIFGGLLSSTVVCSVCKTASRVTEPFLDLSLEIPERFLEFKKVQKKGKRDDDISAILANEKNPKKRKKLQQQLEAQRALQQMMPEKPKSESKEDEKHVNDSRPRLANPSDCSLAACIHAFTDIEILQGENGFGCLECTKRELAAKGIDFDEKKLSNAEVNSESDSDQEEEEEEEEEEKEKTPEQTQAEQKQDDATPEPQENTSTTEQDNKEQPDVWNQFEKSDDSQHAEETTDFFSNTTPTNNTNNNGRSKKDNKKTNDKSKQTKQKDSTKATPKKPAAPSVKLVKRTATKQFLIHKQPRILTLHLKRFMTDAWSISKISKMVKFPTILDLNPYCDADEQRTHLKRYMYRLYGIVVHGGGYGSGHYVAYVRKNLSPNGDDVSGSVLSEISQPHESELKAKWYYFSDSYFREASENEVLTEEAYLLFYERFVVPDQPEQQNDNNNVNNNTSEEQKDNTPSNEQHNLQDSQDANQSSSASSSIADASQTTEASGQTQTSLQ